MKWSHGSREAGKLPASFFILIAVLLGACGEAVNQEPTPTGLTLDCAAFQNNVNPIFDANIGGRTCSASGCHAIVSSSGGAFKIYPNALPNTLEMQVNYLVAKGFSNLNSPADSKLLLEPLAGAQSIVGSHAGGDIFVDTNDPNYTTTLNWINSSIQGPSACYP